MSLEDDGEKQIYSVFNLPEVVSNVLLNLSARERAKFRLINSNCDQVYKIEEELLFIKLWTRYRDGHSFGYQEETLSNEELEHYQEIYGNLQFHLRVWLTKCSNGRYERENSLLLSICNIGDWRFIQDCPFVNEDFLEEYLDSNLVKSLVCVHMAKEVSYFMDMRSGIFYQNVNIKSTLNWKRLGTIQEWLENMPFDILGKLSMTNKGRKVNYLAKLMKAMEGNNIEAIISLLKQNLCLFPYLKDQFKRREEILQFLLENNVYGTSIIGIHSYLPAFIPYDLRCDPDFVLKYCKIIDFYYYLPTKLRNDTELIIKILEIHKDVTIHLSSVPKELFSDIRVLKILRKPIMEELQYKDFPHLEIDTIEKLMIFGDCNILYPYISDKLLNDQDFIRKFLIAQYGEEYNVNPTNLESVKHPLQMVFIDQSLRSNKSIMENLSQYHLLYLCGDLKRDFDILSKIEKTSILKKVNPLLTLEDYLEIFRKFIQRSPTKTFTFYYYISNLPTKLFNCKEVVLTTAKLYKKYLVVLSKIGSELCKDVQFWRELLEETSYVDIGSFVPHEIRNDPKVFLKQLKYPELQMCSKELLENVEFVEEFLVANNHFEYIYLSPKMRSNKELFMTLSEKDMELFQFASPDLFA
ncbi:predicted protein [Naegleria gruberi]|uniref:Predicted protein n=1 Tax=Naegleria gruberi TaxID=5762 RepID=D2VCB3_NAEGR|nr:uncharacterized protein NAEGRDRAFT_66510 [Naegleria gruberi]EFC45626.1 predicted protein [Naegleria gruberi]|eukprot:XP_002678370.1 predicted protein [Naegleria gruberi strain NEG-M]